MDIKEMFNGVRFIIKDDSKHQTIIDIDNLSDNCIQQLDGLFEKMTSKNISIRKDDDNNCIKIINEDVIPIYYISITCVFIKNSNIHAFNVLFHTIMNDGTDCMMPGTILISHMEEIITEYLGNGSIVI